MTNAGSVNRIKELRVIDFGYSSCLDSQAVYHAVAHSFNNNSKDTLIIISPESTYACIGFFQDAEKEVDLGFCRENNIEVFRREVGGGAVLLDNDQIFFQFIVGRERVSHSVNRMYSDFLEPVVRAYNRLGLDVYHRPINDLQINGRKIGGTGAAEIGSAMVIVGSFMFDFNYELMPRILKVPSDKFRDKVYQNVKEYITTIKKECAKKGISVPGKQAVKDYLIEEVQKKFGAPVSIESSLDQLEKEKLKELRNIISDKSWLLRKGKHFDRKVKVSAEVNVFEGNYKSQGGLMRLIFSTEEGIIKDIDISGDFTMVPSSGLKTIEEAIIGCILDRDEIENKVIQVYRNKRIQSPGLEPADFALAIRDIIEKLK